MKSEEIKRLVAKSENAAVEFKRARGCVPADFWPSYSAFANTDGGVIILGVREKDDKREIEGLANTENVFALVRIGERSGMGLSSLYGTWEKEHFVAPSIVESYEPDRTKVMVEFEADDSELGEKNSELGVVAQELGVNPDFEVLMGAYRDDFRDNARKVYSAFAENPGIDTVQIAKKLNISENSVWRAVRALKDVGLLVREGATRGSRWIVKK